jgi:hypothetical protein
MIGVYHNRTNHTIMVISKLCSFITELLKLNLTTIKPYIIYSCWRKVFLNIPLRFNRGCLPLSIKLSAFDRPPFNAQHQYLSHTG